MPAALYILAIIALVLHILFGYVIPPDTNSPPRGPYFRCVISILVILIVLILWYLLPVHIGN
jgi:hypothetical protein